MIFDILIGLFLLGAFFFGTQSETSMPYPAPDIEQPMIGLGDDFVVLALDELDCTRPPQPTPVLRRLMDDGLILAERRVDMDGYSCFPLTGAAALGPIVIDSVCGGVLDPAEGTANPDLYPPGDQIRDEDRIQVLAFGTHETEDYLLDLSHAMYGPRTIAESGVTDRLFTQFRARSEIFCDDILAETIMQSEAEAEAWARPPVPGVPAPPAPQ
ncbi:MAG: hypothetical protein Q4G25_03730 [Paracoccus sp. (in: a-proteobacteria)]|nr:hypothetical protein [Paracoccus sp. (in: a-proteobacteria)]